MSKHNFNTTFLFLLLGLVGYGTYLLFKPFLVALLLAFILSQLFKNWHKKLTKVFWKKDYLGSFATCSLILLIIIIPLILISGLILTEATQLYEVIQKNHFAEMFAPSEMVVPGTSIRIETSQLHQIIGTDWIVGGMKNAGTILAVIVKSAYQGTSQLFFMTFVMFFSLYYLFKDGDWILRKIMDLSPLKNKQEKNLIKKFIEISRATLKGTLVIAVIQGTLTGLLFALLGMPSSALLGVVTVFFSLIPLLGPVFVWAPAGIIELLIGNIWSGIIIIVFGTLVISLVDNILRPKLVGDDSGLHPLLIFLSTFGGLAIFGIIGFLIGPIIVAMFIAILHIYKTEFKEDLKGFNS